MLTSKGASGITGAGFITLAATLAVVDPRLVPGMAIVLGIDKFMSECRALTNICGNGVACVVVSWWEGELDHDKLRVSLDQADRSGRSRDGGHDRLASAKKRAGRQSAGANKRRERASDRISNSAAKPQGRRRYGGEIRKAPGRQYQQLDVADDGGRRVAASDARRRRAGRAGIHGQDPAGRQPDAAQGDRYRRARRRHRGRRRRRPDQFADRRNDVRACRASRHRRDGDLRFDPRLRIQFMPANIQSLPPALPIAAPTRTAPARSTSRSRSTAW